MKSKFLNLITTSLATSVLLAPIPKAFGQSIESQTTLKELQPLIFDVDNSNRKSNGSGEAQSSELIQEGKARKSMESLPTTAASPATQSSQLSYVEQTDWVLRGLFATLVFLYVVLGFQYRRHRAHRVAVLLQQIETLERIWNMKSHQ
jgi:hypothetical protein